MNQQKSNNLLYFLIIIVLILGSVYYFNNKNTDNNPDYVTNKLKELKKSDIKLKEFKNDSHQLTINYPEDWYQLDLGGAKNVTTPLMEENIILFFDPKEGEDPQTNPLASASVKIKRYVIETDQNIKSKDEWFAYIKAKADTYQKSELATNNQYQLISLALRDDINNKWAVEENYQEQGTMRGKDIYIFNDREFYQLVCLTKQIVYTGYEPYIKAIIDSFKIQ